MSQWLVTAGGGPPDAQVGRVFSKLALGFSYVFTTPWWLVMAGSSI